MKLSVSAYRAHASAHKKILTSSYQQHYGSTAAPPACNPLQTPFTPQFQEHLIIKLNSKQGKRITYDNENEMFAVGIRLKNKNKKKTES
ncbi:unnamed protein product [Pieris macdunnoughi]|uniref:Uncharacterized protein n=1 Tax=Pieris macdunnoughi TaxID=345717 RepID=A0A821UAI2_9NEOP|nr:unnamed protein product [Pieris macdunnoughi]